jgi:hypothetical protein
MVRRQPLPAKPRQRSVAGVLPRRAVLPSVSRLFQPCCDLASELSRVACFAQVIGPHQAEARGKKSVVNGVQAAPVSASDAKTQSSIHLSGQVTPSSSASTQRRRSRSGSALQLPLHSAPPPAAAGAAGQAAKRHTFSNGKSSRLALPPKNWVETGGSCSGSTFTTPLCASLCIHTSDPWGVVASSCDFLGGNGSSSGNPWLVA